MTEEKRIDINGVEMTRVEWKALMQECSHEHFEYPGVRLMDGSKMAICTNCKLIQYEPIARMIEDGDL